MLLGSGPLFAQSLEEQVKALAQPAGSGGNAVLDALEARAQRALASLRHARSRHEADLARPDLRKQLEDALGLKRFPSPQARNPRRTGVLRSDGYRIEKLVYETLPRVEVPAHLYVPEPCKVPAPAILFYNGHWWADSKTRPDFQAFCTNAARLGFVVLTFDPFGQGERGVSTRDHRRTELLLVGTCEQGLAEFESQCALDYLLSRPEVDKDRIGMTGASGGGYNTWITAALDDRIRVLVPVVGTSDFYLQLHHTRGNDWYRAQEHCHFIPGLLRFANNHEFVAMAAPRPTLVINATDDPGFPIGDVHRYGRRLYSDYGKEDKFRYFEDSSSGHGYQVKKREAAYGWFLRWLAGRGDGSPFPEPPTETRPFNSPELRCFEDGRKRPAGPGIIEYVKRLAENPRPAEPEAPPPATAEAAAGTPHKPLPLGNPLSRAPVERFVAAAGDGVKVPAFLARAEDEKGFLLALDDRGKEWLASDPIVMAARKKGWTVCGLDPRGIGELAVSKPAWTAAVSLLLGEYFVQRQAGDLLALAAALQATEGAAGKPFACYARGPSAALLLVHALPELARGHRTAPQWHILRDGFLSYRQFLERPVSLERSYALFGDREKEATSEKEIPFHLFPHRALERLDIMASLGSVKAPGLVVDPIDGDWQPATVFGSRYRVPPQVRLVFGSEWGSQPERLVQDPRSER